MKIYSGNSKTAEKCVLALGSFDAIHKGHIALIEEAKRIARAENAVCGIYTFDIRPVYIINPNRDNKDLYTKSQREGILENMGVDFVFYEEFNEEYMHIPAESFADMLKDKFDNLCAVVVGFDYTFGYGGKGDAPLLCKLGKKSGLSVTVIPPVLCENKVISSTDIRSAVKCGDVSSCNSRMGRYFSVIAPVVHDRGVAKTMNFPTANFDLTKINTIIPNDGVYAVRVTVEGDKNKYFGVANIGIRPTFDLEKRTMEVHLLDFDGDLYGKIAETEFIKKIRDERKFTDISALSAQIKEDISSADKIFEEILK